jgi:hypothetical protein
VAKVKVDVDWLKCRVCGNQPTHYDERETITDTWGVPCDYSGFYCDTHGLANPGPGIDPRYHRLFIEQEFVNNG